MLSTSDIKVVAVQTSTMKLSNLISSTFSYKIGYFMIKLTGFCFFTLKHASNGFEFHQSLFDYLIFILSFCFSFYAAIWGKQTMEIEIKSKILNIGTMFLFQVTLFAFFVTKSINFIRVRAFFNIFKSYEEIDKKVSCIFYHKNF